MNIIIYGKLRVWKQLGRAKSKVKYFFQRLRRGYDDSETWNVDLAFYRWLYPRLKRYTELSDTYPSGYKNLGEWTDEVEEIVDLLGKIVDEEYFFDIESDDDKQKVINWFHKNIWNLWW